MFKPIKSILLATDLTDNCRPAFELAASMATQHQATLVLLHVFDHMPDFLTSRLRGLLGDDEYEKLVERQSDTVQKTLTEKSSSNTLIREALAQFCSAAGIDDDACDYQSREIIVTEGNLVDQIIDQSKKSGVDMIVLGTHRGLLSSNAIGHTIKAVMSRSKIPVMVVPATEA